MIPLRDIIPSRTTPGVTITLIALNVIVFLFQATLTDRAEEIFIYTFGVIPMSFSIVTVFTAMFVHAGLAHLAAERPDHRLRDLAMLAERRHLDVDVARPPARRPDRLGAGADARIGDAREDPGPDPVVQPPAIAPDAERANDVDELAGLRVGRVPNALRRSRPPSDVRPRLARANKNRLPLASVVNSSASDSARNSLGRRSARSPYSVSA